MKIKQLFEKDIERDIRGVVKPGQNELDVIAVELEEYVVTKEINKQFDSFFSNYCKSINNTTDKMGVWISGFFGSGKSHMLKILANILDDKQVQGMSAVDYFEKSKKIGDPSIIGNMKRACQVPTDVILFDIASKRMATAQHSKDSVLNIFLRVFNEKLGYCSLNPWIADLERNLIEAGKYDDFKAKIKEFIGKDWEKARFDFGFVQDDVVDALNEVGMMSTQAASNWCEKAMGDYEITIEVFAQKVKSYLDGLSPMNRIVFLADEVGQYIGDNVRLMLDLQTIVAELGRVCKGRAWVIVTSQQDVSSVTKVIGGDLSKIQGRFDTRLSLSSTDVDEVIRQRILGKTDTATSTLEMLYDQKQSIIKNTVIFKDAANMRLYSGGGDFASDYPFIPYQFDLLGKVLTAIREHSSAGKNLSDGERSMLALFQEAVLEMKDSSEGVLVPFSSFYNPLQKHIDHSHSGVIINAAKNDKLIHPIDENVLKVLFMIKYVKEIPNTIDNITTLMICEIDQDRIALRKQIEESLSRLIKETLVQKTVVKQADEYVFLTNEEQEIAKEIDNIEVQQSDVILKVADIVFGDIYQENKYRHSARYNFDFNKMVDDRYYKGFQNSDIGIKIITPNYSGGVDTSALIMTSSRERNVLIALPQNNSPYFDEIYNIIRINKFLDKNKASTAINYEIIKTNKRIELEQRKERAKIFVEDAIRNATIYVGGNMLQNSAKDASTRINEALSKLMKTVYFNLGYMDTIVSTADLLKILTARSETVIDISDIKESNGLAIKDMLNYVETCSNRRLKLSMKSIKERYLKAPYGFNDEDVEWLVCKLFKQGDINLTVNSTLVNININTTDEIIRYLTRKEYIDRLLLERREKVNEMQVKAIRTLLINYFPEFATLVYDEDYVLKMYKKHTNDLMRELNNLDREYILIPKLPGKTVISDGITLFRSIDTDSDTITFYREAYKKIEDIQDFMEDYDNIKEFFNGQMKTHFVKALNIMSIYEVSKVYIVNPLLTSKASEILRILSMKQPYAQIHLLPHLVEEFTDMYSKHLDLAMDPALAEIAEDKQRVLDELDTDELKNLYSSNVQDKFGALSVRANKSNNVATLKNLVLEVHATKDNLLNMIENKRLILAHQAAMKVQTNAAADAKTAAHIPNISPVAPIRARRTVSIKNIVAGNTWNISSEQDIDRCLAEIKTKLKIELARGEELKLEI